MKNTENSSKVFSNPRIKRAKTLSLRVPRLKLNSGLRPQAHAYCVVLLRDKMVQ